MGRIRVHIMEGHPLATYYLSEVITREAELELTGSQEESEENPGQTTTPDVLLIDTSTTSVDLAKVLRVVRMRYRQSKIVLLGPEVDEGQVLRYLYLGIHGYICFGDVREKLPHAIKAVAEGGLWVPLPSLAHYTKQSRTREDRVRREPGLSEREQP